MTNTNEYTDKLILDIYTAQQKRYNEKHEAVLASHPWIMQSINAYRNSKKVGN